MSVAAIGAPLGGPQRVEPTRTPVSRDDLRAAIGRAYRSVTGRAPSSTLLDNLTAQASLETGRGSQMYNYNFGGIKGSSPSGKTAQCVTHEVVGGATITVRQGFRAYASLDEGAEDYVRVLRHDFGAAFSQAETADAGGFAHALKGAGYYTASESDYAAALKSQGAATSTASSPAGRVSLGKLFDSTDLVRVCNALSESAMRIALNERDAEG